MATVADSTPSTNPSTDSGTAAGQAATGGSPALPGGNTGYSGISGPSAPGSVTSSFQAPTSAMPTSPPTPFASGSEIDDIIPGSPAHKSGFGKGSKRPDISRFSELLKTLSAVNNNQGMKGIDQAAFQEIVSTARIDDAQARALLNGSYAQGDPKNDPAYRTALKQFNTEAWKRILNHARALGLQPSLDQQPDLKMPPNMYDLNIKLQAMGDLPIPNQTLMQLGRNGFDTSGIKSVSDMVAGHDYQQFVSGAKGTTVTYPGTASESGKIDANQEWANFVSNWNNNAPLRTDPLTGKSVNNVHFRDAVMTDLLAIGAIDTSSGTAPTVQQVASAYQSVMQTAVSNGSSMTEAFGTFMVPTTDVAGQTVPLSSANLDQAYVTHVADQILGPNVLTPFQAQALANVAQRAGTNTAAAADLINEGVVSIYLQELQGANPEIITGLGGGPGASSYAAMAYQTIEDSLASWGLSTSSASVGDMAAQVLRSGINTPYQVKDLAQQMAEGYAKQQIQTKFPGLFQASSGDLNNYQSLIDSYRQTASNLLGIPVNSQDLTDPTGKWMAFASGGSGPGGMMTQAEYAQKLMSDPQYGYTHSQTFKNQESAGAAGLLQLLGKTPQTGSNPWAGTSVIAGMGETSGSPGGGGA